MSSSEGHPTAVDQAIHLFQNQPGQWCGRRTFAVGLVPHRQQRLDGGVEEAGQAQVEGPAAQLPVAPPRLRPRRRGLRLRRQHAWSEWGSEQTANVTGEAANTKRR